MFASIHLSLPLKQGLCSEAAVEETRSGEDRKEKEEEEREGRKDDGNNYAEEEDGELIVCTLGGDVCGINHVSVFVSLITPC